MSFLTRKLSTLYGLIDPSIILPLRYKLQLAPSHRTQQGPAMYSLKTTTKL